MRSMIWLAAITFSCGAFFGFVVGDSLDISQNKFDNVIANIKEACEEVQLLTNDEYLDCLWCLENDKNKSSGP